MSTSPSLCGLGHDPFNDRYKFTFIDRAVRSQGGLTDLLRFYADQATQSATRFCLRVFVGHEVDPAAISVCWRGQPIKLDAMVPIRDHPTVTGYAYFSANLPERETPDEMRMAQWDLLRRIQMMESHPIDSSVVVEHLMHPTSADIASLLDLYAERYTSYLCPFTPESVRGMIENNIVYIVRDRHGAIVCVCVAEVVEVTIDEAVLRFSEISDAATAARCAGQGLYKAVKVRLMEDLRRRDPCMAITAEARAISIGALKANTDFRMVVAGHQARHCIISSKEGVLTQDGPFGDLFVFYLP